MRAPRKAEFPCEAKTLRSHGTPWRAGYESHDPVRCVGNKSKGAPGLAFETWDPCNRSPLETPLSPFVIPGVAEGSAVLSTSHQCRSPQMNCHPDRSVAQWRDLLFLRVTESHAPKAAS